MTIEECTATLTGYALAYRAPMDAPTFRAYFKVIGKMPVVLLEAALEAWGGTGNRFFPGAPEILATAELVRRQQLALHPYTGCAECEDQIGWRRLMGQGGQVTVSRCPCQGRHRDKLQAMGLLEPIAQLAGESEPQTETYHPDARHLPSGLRQRVLEAAERKALR